MTATETLPDLFAVCVVDEVPTEVLNKLLIARDAYWRELRRTAGKNSTNDNGYSDGVKLTPVSDPEWYWKLSIAKTLEPGVTDDVIVSVQPIEPFTSPFLHMSPEQVLEALEAKATYAPDLITRQFVIVDTRSIQDDTVLMCERQDEDEEVQAEADETGDGRAAASIQSVRTRFPALLLALVNLDLCNLGMDDYQNAAAKHGGICEDDQEGRFE